MNARFSIGTWVKISTLLAASAALGIAALGSQFSSAKQPRGDFDERIADHADDLLRDGKRIFRLDTFGDQAFWGGRLRLHEAIAGAEHGGVGEGVSPATALSLGLKVDIEALPRKLVKSLERGEVDLDDPASTLALLRHDAVVGIRGFFDGREQLTSVGIQCALCHSTVDDSFAAGIGRRLDGWANRDLNVGAIVAVAPDLSFFTDLLGVDDATVRQVLNQWGPGKFDAAMALDGKTAQPTGETSATLIPPAFGLAGINLHTWTGWGSVTHWNAFVANLEMHGQGTFYDPRLEDATKFPIAAANGFGNVRSEQDLITGKLGALQFYQLAIPAPRAPEGSFDRRAARRGQTLFSGKADCARCHVPPIYTEPGWNLHTASEIGIDGFQASRSPDERYRTAPLRGLWTHAKGGFYHDGRFPTLVAVVEHYDGHFGLGLTPAERIDLIEFLKSL